MIRTNIDIKCQYDGVAHGLEKAAECLRDAGDHVKMANPIAEFTVYPGARNYAQIAVDVSKGTCPAALALLAIAQKGFQMRFVEPQPVQGTIVDAIGAGVVSNDYSEGFEMREAQRERRGDLLQGILRELISGSPLVRGQNTVTLLENPAYLCGGCKYSAQG